MSERAISKFEVRPESRPVFDLPEGECMKDRLEARLGFELPPLAGRFFMMVEVYTRPTDETLTLKDGQRSSILMPEVVRVEDEFRKCTGLVLMLGSDCYYGDQWAHSGPLCQVGDWIVFPRNSGTQINYRGVPVQLIHDDKMLLRIDNPTYVTRGE